MAKKLQDVVAFRSDLLFDGAVNVDWFLADDRRRKAAAESFVFHGPKYHGVSQEDVGSTHGHRLIDTATFANSVVKRCLGAESQPFTLAIAGYGTGKSHLALTLAMLLSDPTSDTAKKILSNIKTADPDAEKELRALIKRSGGPSLVVALNGMRNFDLTAEITRQVKQQLRARDVDTTTLDDVRPRFGQAASIIRLSSKDVVSELLTACDVQNEELLLGALDSQDELIYAKVQEFFEARGSRIRALGGESLQDVLDTICRTYCGEAKAFKQMVVLFDEFGRYTEFATISKHIAGSGVLQELFEGIQSNSERAIFIGFIQFELSAYVQRVAPEYKNEILRYVTRYDNADKVYLSINLETLIANLLDKKDPEFIDELFDTDDSIVTSSQIAINLHQWFPLSLTHRLWNDEEQFHSIVRKGCWPLSPYSTWFLFHLAAAGKHLQQRSALALLASVLPKYANMKISDGEDWALAPADLWSDQLQEELINTEEGGQQGAIAIAYTAVYNKHGAQLSEDQITILRAIVLASKMGLRVSNRDDAKEAIAALAGLPSKTINTDIDKLQDEYNVVEWDEGFKVFEILGDAVPRTAFLAFLKKQTDKVDENSRANLFMAKAAQLSSLLGDLDCDFGEKHEISTKEWKYQSFTSNIGSLAGHLKWAKNRWDQSVDVDVPRGTISYCYIERSRDARVAESEVKKMMRSLSKESNDAALPILVVLLYDDTGTVGQILTELTILQDQLKEDDRARFGKLIPAHQDKTIRALDSYIESMLKERRLVALVPDGKITAQRLQKIGTEIFEHIYSKVISFPFDGFSTARGNAADTCQLLTSDLLSGKLDYDSVISKPIKVKNRAIAVLKDCWDVFGNDGAISKRPKQNNVRKIFDHWDELLKEEGGSLNLGNELQNLFQPPYGANIASAGLLLGVFVAARMDKLTVVKNGNPYAISQWLQDGIFKGKFLDYKGLQDVRLALVGEAASEWTSLFDDWDEAESYLDRIRVYDKAVKLKDRIPLPPGESYRFDYMGEQSTEARRMIKQIETAQDDALNKLENGLQKDDVSLISWAASDLAGLIETMVVQQPRWTKEQIEQFKPDVASARQKIIQLFPQWLKRQTLLSTQPDAVGNFKHKMLHNIGGSLKKLDLGDQYISLENHISKLVRDVETVAAAGQLIRDVEGWLLQHRDALKIVRIAEIRGLADIAKDYKSKLQSFAKKTQQVDLNNVIGELVDFQKKLDNELISTQRLGGSIWESTIENGEDIDMLTQKVEMLCTMYEGCKNDLDAFKVLRSALRTYGQTYRHLQDDKLTWEELDNAVVRYQSEIDAQFGVTELPWNSEDTLGKLLQYITNSRIGNSSQWINDLQDDISKIESMPVAEVNRLFDRTNSPPAYLTSPDRKSLTGMRKDIENRLNALAVEWLMERFLELPDLSKKRFLELIKQKTKV